MRRGALRTIDAQVTRRLVYLVLHQIERRDLDECIDDPRRLGARLEAMPGMRTPAGIRTGRRFRHDELWEIVESGGGWIVQENEPGVPAQPMLGRRKTGFRWAVSAR